MGSNGAGKGKVGSDVNGVIAAVGGCGDQSVVSPKEVTVETKGKIIILQIKSMSCLFVALIVVGFR